MTTPARYASPGPLWLVAAGLILLLVTAAVITPADADLWGHLTFGRDIVESGNPIQGDRYSFASDRPWVNHEWLAEVIFSEVYRRGGSTGLIALKLGVILAVLAVVGWHLRNTGATTGLRAAILAFVFVGTYWRTHTVRPQLFSVLLCTLLLIVLRQAEAGRLRPLIGVPIILALWVNLHGGWIVGLGVLGLWSAIRVLDRRTPQAERLALIATTTVALGATLFGPDGVVLWTFLLETVRLGRDDIEEWGSIFTSPLGLIPPWALSFAAAAWALGRSGGERRWHAIAVSVMLALASFRVSRLDAFFALIVAILLLPELAKAWQAIRIPVGSAHAQAPRSRGALAVTLLAATAMTIPVAGVIRPYATCLTMTGAWLPEPEARTFIQQNRLRGRLLTWFDWGEYAIWHFTPALVVSMDGRRETVYTDAAIQAHRRFYRGDPSGLPWLRQLDPDYIWLPARLPVISQLLDEGWVAAFRGPVSVVLAKPDAGPFDEIAPSSGDVPRCFPGP